MYVYLLVPAAMKAAESSSSEEEEDEEVSDDPSTWKLSAYTRQKARQGRKLERKFITNSSSSEDIDSESQEPHSLSSCDEDEDEEEVTLGEGESVSESSEACGAAGFFDDEAMEVCFSSELEEIEREGSGESEVDGEEEDSEERRDGGGGFFIDEAEEEEAFQARKRRRRRHAISSSSSCSSDDNAKRRSKKKTENGQKTNLNLNIKRAKVIGSSSGDEDEKPAISQTIENGKVHETTKENGEAESNDAKQSQEEERSSISSETDEESSSDVKLASGDTTSSSDSEGESGSESDNVGENADKEMPSNLKWKIDLLARARQAYDMRNKRSTSLRKLVYSDLPLDHDERKSAEEAEKQEGDKEGEREDDSFQLGGLFQLAKKKESLSMNHRDDVSLPRKGLLALSCDWSDSVIAPAIKSLFVTGSWGDQDAKALLDEDEAMYGDFEDLETGEKHGERESANDDKELQSERETAEEKRLKKKKNLKARFDVEYDDQEGGEAGYLEDLKREISEQEQRNRAEFEGLDDQTRVQYEGYRPGTYVRMELKGTYMSLAMKSTTVKLICNKCTFIYMRICIHVHEMIHEVMYMVL